MMFSIIFCIWTLREFQWRDVTSFDSVTVIHCRKPLAPSLEAANTSLQSFHWCLGVHGRKGVQGGLESSQWLFFLWVFTGKFISWIPKKLPISFGYICDLWYYWGWNSKWGGMRDFPILFFSFWGDIYIMDTQNSNKVFFSLWHVCRSTWMICFSKPFQLEPVLLCSLFVLSCVEDIRIRNIIYVPTWKMDPLLQEKCIRCLYQGDLPYFCIQDCLHDLKRMYCKWMVRCLRFEALFWRQIYDFPTSRTPRSFWWCQHRCVHKLIIHPKGLGRSQWTHISSVWGYLKKMQGPSLLLKLFGPPFFFLVNGCKKSPLQKNCCEVSLLHIFSFYMFVSHTRKYI